jgi:hypothetical protein
VSARSLDKTDVMSAIFFRKGVGSMPCFQVVGNCNSRRRVVSEMCKGHRFGHVEAYMCTSPDTFLAARTDGLDE